MSHNVLLAEKLEADRYLSLLLEKSIHKTKEEALKQAKLIESGIQRLTWYSSCFFENYKDVCEKQKIEDIRFAKALIKIIKNLNSNVINEMVTIFVDQMVRGLSDERIRNITRILARNGSSITTSTLTKLSFSYTIASAVSSGFDMRAAIDSATTVWTGRAVLTANLYGYVQKAANAAERLKKRNLIYYSALYQEELEMLYFLIEPLINRVDNFGRSFLTDQEIASNILRITS
ncbi:hypothetical protein [Erwinia phyllosphaerae]|uniref:hypothetical protein n=1 Tax=Erwinia phyllosphaerae TaxID=2853256 RepID=UPI001FEFB6D8|nr:hypothetical protein [Erwinia phyllosphaerae]MBV4366315.1 hypothetical protein [Erwinia phyllosphaerae]